MDWSQVDVLVLTDLLVLVQVRILKIVFVECPHGIGALKIETVQNLIRCKF